MHKEAHPRADDSMSECTALAVPYLHQLKHRTEFSEPTSFPVELGLPSLHEVCQDLNWILENSAWNRTIKKTSAVS